MWRRSASKGPNISMRKSKKAPTVYDVAKLAEVSASTVSRFLNRTTYVSDEKSQNI
ncbi:LacI family transcriptional regulator, partial [Vibrio anguillarum]|nr:LacI family transcriptional regulator [Vibrio anguillarum]